MSVYSKDGNSFYKRIYIGVDEYGKKKFKKIKAKSEKELLKRENELRRKLKSGIDIKKESDSLAKWIKRYLDSAEMLVNAGSLKLSEYKLMKSRLDYFLKYDGGIFAATGLKDILPSDIVSVINTLMRKNPYIKKATSKTTAGRYLDLLSNVFEFAREERAYAYTNPCKSKSVKKAKDIKSAKSNKRKPLNNYTIGLVLETEHRAQLSAYIMLMAGLRRGELTALEWSDIDFDKRIINVNKSYDFKECEFKDPKTISGIRKIPINDALYNMLMEKKDTSTGKYVIEKSRGGGRMTESSWRRLFESYMLALEAKDKEKRKEDGFVSDEEFERFTPHQLRHTYCSILYWSGVDLKTAQVLMGHSDLSVTANIYTHENDKVSKEAADIQGEFIKDTFNLKVS